MSRCDFPGCRKFPAVEVYKIDDCCWSYLCKIHHEQEMPYANRNIGICELTKVDIFKAVTDFLWDPVYKIYTYIYYNYIYKPSAETIKWSNEIFGEENE